MAPPLIGITCAWNEDEERFYLGRHYVRAVETAGGLPVALPALVREGGVEGLLGVLDGLLLAGGGDLDPFYFGEEPLPVTGEIAPERDRFELALARGALRLGLPVLGICRGLQVLNVAAGGTLYQDLAQAVPRPLKHYQQAPRWYATHGFTVAGGSRLAGIMGAGYRRVNSFHHQAVARVAPGFRATAWAPDGVVEAVEATGPGFALGVQFHPEGMAEQDAGCLALFAALVEAARLFSRGRPGGTTGVCRK